MLLRFASGVAVAVALASSASVAAAAPSATIDRVQLAPRAALYEDAWLRTEDQYRTSYVKPQDGWRVQLDGCSSRSDNAVPESPVPALSWRLEPVAGQPDVAPIVVDVTPGDCAVRARLRALGRWRITLTARDAAGAIATATRQMTFRDVLVAAIGDSFTSGEGQSAHAPGVSLWLDRQCHRGRRPWPLQLAKSLENDATTVTFVNFACSGASPRHLSHEDYEGADPAPADEDLAPQLTKLRELLGDPLLPEPQTRTVDLLLGTAGINDLNVGSTLEDCSLDRFSGTHLAWLGLFLSDCERDFGEAFVQLPGAYDRLELAISENVRVGQFHIVGYPARLLTDGGDKYPKKITALSCLGFCKVRALACFPFENLRVADKQFVTKSVERVNALMRDASQRFGWWTRTPTLRLFRRHGYCAIGYGRPWFRRLLGSLDSQHDERGTAHPLRRGHEATAKAVREAVRLDVRAPTPDAFTVSVLTLRLTLAQQDLPQKERPRVFKALQVEVPGAATSTCRARAPAGVAVPEGQCQIFDVQTAGRTVAVKAAATIQRFVPSSRDDPAEPGTGHGESTELVAQRFLRRADGWDVGRLRRIVVANGRFGTVELEYKVTRPSDGLVLPTLAATSAQPTGRLLLASPFPGRN